MKKRKPGRPRSSVLVQVKFALHPDYLDKIAQIKRRKKLDSNAAAVRHAIDRAVGA